VTLPTGTTPTDAADAVAAPKGPLLADRAPSGTVNALAGAPKLVAVQPDVPADTRAAENPPAAANAPSDAAAGAPAAQQPAVASEQPDLTPAEPLSGPVPLPPRRPRLLAMAQMTPQAVPIPRPRPEAVGPAAAETTPGPFDWLQNMFRKNSE